MKTICIGMLGGGFMGRTHTFGYRNLGLYCDSLPFRVRLKTICTAHADSAQKAKETYGFEVATTDPDVIFSDPEIDVVDISTPNTYHKDALLAAIRAGKHIYCEKPVVVNSCEADEVEAALQSANDAIRMTVFNYRFVPAILRARELVQEGKLGRLLTFRSSYCHNSSVDPNKKIGWKQSGAYGGGVLLDLGSHAADLLEYVSGEKIVKVCGKSQIGFPVRKGIDGEEWHTDADEAFYMLAEISSGACGTVEANKLATGANDSLSIELRGTKGALSFSLMDPSFLYFYDGAAPADPIGGVRGYTRIECVGRMPAPAGVFPSVKAPFGWERTHLYSLYAFLSAVYAGGNVSPSLEDGLAINRLLFAARESDRIGRWVTV